MFSAVVRWPKVFIRAITRTFEGILSVAGGAVQALDGANHDRRCRLGRTEADYGQEHNKRAEEHSSSTSRNHPSPHDGRTPTEEK
jgi:hypothetical protein